MYEFWHDYVKPKNDKKPKICYMDTKSFIVHVQTDGIYNDIAEVVETRFNTSNFETDRPLPKRNNNKSNSIKEIWIRRITLEINFWINRAKTYSYLKDDNDKDKKAKDTKKFLIKRT